MSIQKETRTNGKRCYAVRWSDETGRHRSRRFDRKGDAEKYEVEVKRLKQTGDLISFDCGRISLAEFGREWFTTYAKENLADSTQVGYAGMWDRHILPRLGGHSLRRLYAEPELIQGLHQRHGERRRGPGGNALGARAAAGSAAARCGVEAHPQQSGPPGAQAPQQDQARSHGAVASQGRGTSRRGPGTRPASQRHAHLSARLCRAAARHRRSRCAGAMSARTRSACLSRFGALPDVLGAEKNPRICGAFH